MYKRFQAENLYVTKLTQTMNPIWDVGDAKEEFSLYVSQMPKYSKWFVMVDFTTTDRKDVIRFHDVDTNTNELKYYRCNRDLLNTWAIDLSHAVNAVVQINDVAEWFNYLFANTDDFWMIETLWNNNINVAWWRVFINDVYVTVADLVTTALANWTYTAILDYSDNTLKLQTDVSAIEWIALWQVVIATWVDPVVTDRRWYNAPLKYDADIFQIVDGELRLISGVAISQATTVSVGSIRLWTLDDHEDATAWAVAVQTSNLKKTSAWAADENKVPILNASWKLAEWFMNVWVNVITNSSVWTDVWWDDAYVVTLTPAPTSYIDGMEILFKATTANTGACSIDVNALWVKNIKTPLWNDPQNWDIPSNKWKRLRYDGTNFIIVDLNRDEWLLKMAWENLTEWDVLRMWLILAWQTITLWTTWQIIRMGSSTNEINVWQSFTATVWWKLTSVNIPMRKIWALVSTITAELRTWDWVTLLETSSTTFTAASLTTSYVSKQFLFNDFVLLPWVQYRFYLYWTGFSNTSNCVEIDWRTSSWTTYTWWDAYSFFSGVWTVQTGSDLWGSVSISATWETNTSIYKATAKNSEQSKIVWFANNTATAWNNVAINHTYNNKRTWLVINTNYFLSNTPWAIDTSPWIISRVVWRSISTTEMLINLFW